MSRLAYLFGGLVAIVVLFFSGCTHPATKEGGTTKTLDHIDSITVYCDEAFRDLISQEITIYETTVPDQHIRAVYLPETQVLKHLTEDSFTYIVIGRKLREQERDDIYHKTHLQTEEHSFATDAIAIVANPKLDKDTLAYTEVLSLLTNTTHTYKLVFEGNGSGVINYMFTQIVHSELRPSAYAAKSLDELVEYLQKDNKTIGFMPFSRISDENDTTARNLLKKVKVLYIAKADSTGRIGYATASQSEIADGSYPFDRPINFVGHSMDERVGTGFVNFLYREQSGRIILKAGLVPAIMPQRVVNVNTDTLK